MHSPPKILGYRGSVLLVMGLIWLMLGAGKFLSPPSPNEALLPTHYVPHQILAGLWCVTGVAATVCAFRTRAEGDAFGWIALYVMPALLTVSYSIAWIQAIFDLGGMALGWLGAAVYFALAVIVLICAGWPEPADGGGK
jgi:hypothetical protein